MNDLSVTLKIDGKRYRVPVLEITTHKSLHDDEITIKFYRKSLPYSLEVRQSRPKIELVGRESYTDRRVSAWLDEWDSDEIITVLFDKPNTTKRKGGIRWTEWIYEKFFSMP